MIRQHISCWFFGIVGSLLSIFLFFHSQLYSEAILYFYYVIMGFYGYFLWSQKDSKNESFILSVNEFKFFTHFICFSICSFFALGMAWLFDTYTDADRPYLDAFTTVFSFFATYLEAKKVLSGWLYWIVINGITILLYTSKGLDIYAALTVVYFLMSFVGYYQWRRTIGS